MLKNYNLAENLFQQRALDLAGSAWHTSCKSSVIDLKEERRRAALVTSRSSSRPSLLNSYFLSITNFTRIFYIPVYSLYEYIWPSFVGHAPEPRYLR